MDRFRILIATDNHLGYMEKDPIRGNDSFSSFREILEIASRENVDFILLGGDLFHDNKPSLSTLTKTMQLMRRFCMGDRPIYFRLLSDPSKNFQSNCFSTLNVHDMNFNIAIPIFSIHGNHDDPVDQNICALDLLSSTGIVNYFGKASNFDDICISPILLEKGKTKLAVYGLGNIRDERLHRAFVHGKVAMMRPDETPDDWFNMFVIHQNRVAHGPKNFIPETFLNDFLDLILWGHEHECLIEPAQNGAKEFHITQPGSSIATSLSEGESKKKHVGILEVEGKAFKIKKIPLKTVRPFVIKDIVLKTITELQVKVFDQKSVEDYLTKQVETLVDEVTNQWKSENSHINDQDVPLPLIRLRVEYSDCSSFNPLRFGQKFIGKLANPKDILNFYKSKGVMKDEKNPKLAVPQMPRNMDVGAIEDYIKEFVMEQNSKILPDLPLVEALKKYVDKDSKDALLKYYSHSIKKSCDYAVQNCVVQDMDMFMRDELQKLKLYVFEKENNNPQHNEDQEDYIVSDVDDVIMNETQNDKVMIVESNYDGGDNETIYVESDGDEVKIVSEMPAKKKHTKVVQQTLNAFNNWPVRRKKK